MSFRFLALVAGVSVPLSVLATVLFLQIFGLGQTIAGAEAGPTLRLASRDGHVMALVGELPDGSHGFGLWNRGSLAASLMLDAEQPPALVMNDDRGNERVAITLADSTGDPQIAVSDSHGSLRALLTVGDAGPSIQLLDENGRIADQVVVTRGQDGAAAGPASSAGAMAEQQETEPSTSELLLSDDASADASGDEPVGLTAPFAGTMWPAVNGWLPSDSLLQNDGSDSGDENWLDWLWNTNWVAAPRDLQPRGLNYAVEAEIQVLERPGCGSFGIVVRGEYQIGVHDCESGGAPIFSIRSRTPEVLAARAMNQASTFPGAWHHYRVEARDANIRAFVDGVLMAETDYASGGEAGAVGLWDDNTPIAIRAIRVTDLSSADANLVERLRAVGNRLFGEVTAKISNIVMLVSSGSRP